MMRGGPRLFRPHIAPCCLLTPLPLAAACLGARRQALETFTPRQLRLLFVLQPWERRMMYGEQVGAPKQSRVPLAAPL